jgi:hypothetical protein
VKLHRSEEWGITELISVILGRMAKKVLPKDAFE